MVMSAFAHLAQQGTAEENFAPLSTVDVFALVLEGRVVHEDVVHTVDKGVEVADLYDSREHTAASTYPAIRYLM